jgi:hypothetical protein
VMSAIVIPRGILLGRGTAVRFPLARHLDG